MHVTILFYTHAVSPSVVCVTSSTAYISSGTWSESSEAHLTFELISIQDSLTFVDAQFEPSKAVIRIYWSTGYFTVAIFEIHRKATLWYIFISNEATVGTLSYLWSSWFLSLSSLLLLSSVIPLVILGIDFVTLWLSLLL